MASPQTENGYTKVANELLEEIVNTSLLGSEFQVLFAIIRRTYGFNKKQDVVSLSQFQKDTGLSRPTIVKTLKNLMARKMVVKIYLPEAKIAFSINKDYDSWVVNTSKLVKGKWVTSKDVLTETSKDVLTHKRKKEIYTKEIATTSVAPFSLKEEIQKLEDSPRRDMQIIGYYLSERKPDIRSKQQLQTAIRRHLRAAKSLSPFDDDQIVKGFKRARDLTNGWTLETCEKILTK